MALITAGPGRRSCGAVLSVLTLAALAILAILAVLAMQPAGAESATVAMRGTAFVPGTVRVQQVAGEPGFPAAHGHAIWTNEDQAEHTVTFADTRLVSSGRIALGQRFEAVLTVAGSFTYTCVIHPSMTGTVEVVSAAATPSTGVTTGPAMDVDEGSPLMIALVLVGVGVAAALGWFLLRRRRIAGAGSVEP